MKGHGLGVMLMNKVIDYCRSRGTREIVGEALLNNSPLLEMVRRLGFDVHPAIGEGVAILRLPLQGEAS